MALLFSSPVSAFSAIEAALQDDWMAFDPFGPALCRRSSCGLAACGGCAGPAWPAVAPPTAASFRLHRQPSFAPPAEPEVHISRTQDGVVAACPLGRAFSGRDISLKLSGRDLTITAFHPGTAHWAQRPAAYRRTLQLADHIDAGRIQASLQGGVLTLLFPYRLQQPVAVVVRPTPASAPLQQRARLVVLQAPAASPARTPMPAPAAATAPVPCSTAAAAAPAACTQEAACASSSTCAPPAEATAAPASFRRAHHRRNHRQHARRCAEQCQHQQELTGPCATRREQLLTQHRQQAASPTRQQPAAVPKQPEQRAQRAQQPSGPRVIPVEGPASPRAAEPHPPVPAAAVPQPAQPAPAAAAAHQPAPAAEQPPAAAAAAASGKGKGKAPASPEQAAAMERRRRAQAATARIAAGVASDSDYDDADGSVEDCALDD